MTKAQQNEIIKEVWTRKLRDRSDIPDTISETYANWLIGKIKSASQQLTAIGQAQQQAQLEQAQNGSAGDNNDNGGGEQPAA